MKLYLNKMWICFHIIIFGVNRLTNRTHTATTLRIRKNLHKFGVYIWILCKLNAIRPVAFIVNSKYDHHAHRIHGIAWRRTVAVHCVRFRQLCWCSSAPFTITFTENWRKKINKTKYVERRCRYCRTTTADDGVAGVAAQHMRLRHLEWSHRIDLHNVCSTKRNDTTESKRINS